MCDALAWARAYADHGLAILPVRPDKTPLTPHGLKDASVTQPSSKVVAGWPFADCAWALPATVVAIDIDVKPGRNGYQGFEHLQGCDPRDVMTPTTSTPSGGWTCLGKVESFLKERGAFHGQAAATVREGI